MLLNFHKSLLFPNIWYHYKYFLTLLVLSQLSPLFDIFAFSPSLLIIKCSESGCLLSCISSLRICVSLAVESEFTHNNLAQFKIFYVFILNNVNLLSDSRFSNGT